jgi:hypothetical protein
MLVQQPDPTGEGVDLQPRIERLLHAQRHQDLALATALSAHEQAIVSGVCPGPAQITGAEASQLGAAKPAVAEHSEEGVVAFAGQRAAVRDAQQVRVVDVGERLGRARLMPGDSHTLHLVLAAKIVGERSDHGQIHARGGRCRRAPTAATSSHKVARVGGDRVRVEIADHGRAAELAPEPVAERAKDRCVLPAGARRRRPGGAPLPPPNRWGPPTPAGAGAAITTTSAGSSAIVPSTSPSSTTGSAGARTSCWALTDPSYS